jgi:mono/diheme cytochrome c family protein
MSRPALRMAAVALLSALATGCAGHQAGTVVALPPAGPVPRAALPAQPSPPRTYENACGPCHANGGLAVRILADRYGAARSLIHQRTDLPVEVVRTIVRSGMGAMLPMSRAEVSDTELDGIAACLARRTGTP